MFDVHELVLNMSELYLHVHVCMHVYWAANV